MKKRIIRLTALMLVSLLIPCSRAANEECVLQTTSFQVYASDPAIDNFSDKTLSLGYIRFIQENPKVNNLSLDEYVSTYAKNQIDDITLFNELLSRFVANNKSSFIIEDFICDTKKETHRSSSLPIQWYHNTGTSLPKAVSYDEYDLLNLAKRGDIIYERAGGFNVTGHIAVVEGVYWDYNEGQYYVRLIEAISCGVSRSIIEDTRFKNQRASLLEVTPATTSIRNSAVQFCAGELGKAYNVVTGKGYLTDNISWYCSELAWGAYYTASNYNIILDSSESVFDPVLPLEIYQNANTRSLLDY